MTDNVSEARARAAYEAAQTGAAKWEQLSDSVRKHWAGVAAAVLGVQPAEPVYWQWRRTMDGWSTFFIFPSEPAVTAPDTEKRALYAGPVVPFGTPGDLS